MITGVYLIKNNVTKSVRVGSAKDIQKRFSSYKADLRNGNANRIMQRDFNFFGEQSFDFIILEECTIENLFEMEKYYLEKVYDNVKFYNVNRVMNTEKKIRTSEEANIYRQARSKLTSGTKNGMCSVLTEQTASEILWLKENTKMPQGEIGEIYGCKGNLVSRIGKDRWSNVTATKPMWVKEIDCTLIQTTSNAIAV